MQHKTFAQLNAERKDRKRARSRAPKPQAPERVGPPIESRSLKRDLKILAREIDTILTGPKL